MKQHITVDQLDELTEKQKEKLRDMWEPIQGELFYYSDKDDWYYGDGIYRCAEYKNNKIEIIGERQIVKEYCLPVLSIGQMIEILEKNIEIIKPLENMWRSNIKSHPLNIDADELCDALWSAIKLIL